MHGWFSLGKIKFEKMLPWLLVEITVKSIIFHSFLHREKLHQCHGWYSKYTPAFQGLILKCYGWNSNFSVNFTNSTVKFVKSTVKFTNIRVKFSKNRPNLYASFSRHRRFTLTLQSWRYCCVCIGFRVARMLPWTVVTRHRRSRPAEARNPHITAHCGEVRAHEAF